MLAIMTRAFKRINQPVRLDVIPLDDNGAGVAATGVFTLTGVATEAGTLTFKVGSARNGSYTIAIADLKARVDLLEQAIAILETEIEALAVQVNENSAAIEALKIAILDLNQEIEEIKDWIKAHSLDDHIDVDLSAPSAGDYFVYKNGKWTNEAQCNMKCNTYIPSLATL